MLSDQYGIWRILSQLIWVLLMDENQQGEWAEAQEEVSRDSEPRPVEREM